MTVKQRSNVSAQFALDRLGIGPEDARQARLIAGSAVARLDQETAFALGLSEGSKAMERRLAGAQANAFLIARDIAGDPGFAAKRNGSIAVRRQFGGTGVSFSGESGDVWQPLVTSASGSPYRWTSLGVDRKLGRTTVSADLSRLEVGPNRVEPGFIRKRLECGPYGAARLDRLCRRKVSDGRLQLRPRKGRRIGIERQYRFALGAAAARVERGLRTDAADCL